MSDDIFLQLSKAICTHHCELSSELLAILNSELRSTLTLRSLVNLCVACKQQPTAQMLAFALQNSIPSLTGLPMDDPRPEFYISVAKKFFGCKYFVSFAQKMDLYKRIHNYDGGNHFFPQGTDLYSPGPYWACGMDYYVRHTIGSMGSVRLGTNAGRKLAKKVMLGWKTHYNGWPPEYHDFIDRVLRILDHAFVLEASYNEIHTIRL
jgi:hypothetical protein